MPLNICVFDFPSNCVEARKNSSLVLERCFANIIVKVPSVQLTMILPGHDYSRELLSMQLDINNSSNRHRTKPWQNFSPYDFFETASQYLVSIHHRSLPSGKRILNVPIGLEREIVINPHFRSLSIHCENLIHALNIWSKAHYGFMKDVSSPSFFSTEALQSQHSTSESTIQSWNLGMRHTNHSVFTTVYSADVKELISLLRKSEISNLEAAQHLEKMIERLKVQLTTKSFSVTANITSDVDKAEPVFSHDTKVMKDALNALSSIGTPPQALTVSDSVRMNLPQPQLASARHGNTLISKSRSIKVLVRLGLLRDQITMQKLSSLFDEALRRRAAEWQHNVNGIIKRSDEEIPSLESIRIKPDKGQTIYESCIETTESDEEEIVELRYLKIALLGNNKEEEKKQGFLTSLSLCLPCNDSVPETKKGVIQREQKIRALLYHDMCRCPVCKETTACPLHWRLNNNQHQAMLEEQPPTSQGIECDELMKQH